MESWTSKLEQEIVDRLAPGKSVYDAEAFIPALLEKTNERLRSHRLVAGHENLTTAYKCKFCKNNNQGLFEEDSKMAQVTCTVCGIVIVDRKVHDGEWKRQFEGDENPSQHGPAPDPRFSSGHNLRTNMNIGSGPVAGGSKVSKKELMDLKNAQERVEMNLSNMKFGIDRRATRIGYKDKQKKEVFVLMEELCGSMQLHEKVLTEAQGYFADYRDALEQIQQRDLVAAAALIHALRNNISSGVFSSATSKRKLEDGDDDTEASSKRHASRAPVASFEALHPFVCKKCARSFGTKKDLRFHMRNCPNKDKGDMSPQELADAISRNTAKVQDSIALNSTSSTEIKKELPFHK